jgi:hypothetical protein
MTLERVFVPPSFPSPFRYLRAHAGRFALVPVPRGEEGPLPVGYYSDDGARFEPATYGFEGVDPGPTPVVATVCERQLPAAGGDGRLLYGFGRKLLETRIGPALTLRPTACVATDEMRVRRQALTTTADGRWWSGGHLGADSAKGMIHRSDDGGATWSLFAEKLPGSVGLFVETGRGLCALAHHSVMLVSADGVTEIAKYKDEVWNVVVDARGTFGFGERFAAFAAAAGKRQKYAELPVGGGGRAAVAAVQGGFVLGRLGGLWTSPDALVWTTVPGWNDHLVAGRTRRDVMTVVACQDGALVATGDGEIFYARVT